jgi:hypothetical protein
MRLQEENGLHLSHHFYTHYNFITRLVTLRTDMLRYIAHANKMSSVCLRAVMKTKNVHHRYSTSQPLPCICNNQTLFWLSTFSSLAIGTHVDMHLLTANADMTMFYRVQHSSSPRIPRGPTYHLSFEPFRLLHCISPASAIKPRRTRLWIKTHITL